MKDFSFQNNEELLKLHKLKVTKNRISILEVFHSVGHALSYNDVNHYLKNSLDKVTVYRTLKSFQESGLIHEILDGSSHSKFALYQDSNCPDQQYFKAHVHFKCNSCDKTFCLNTVQIPNIQLPEGFETDEQFVSFNGKCNNCNEYSEI